jgi:hypothetical protein
VCDESQPLTIYLDSSDISNMASAADPFWREARDALKSAAHSGHTVFRFSVIHMMEITHLDQRSKPMAVERGRLIKELCGPRCLTFWLDLVLAEGLAHLQGAKLARRIDTYRDDGRWYPDVSSLELGASERLKGEIASVLKHIDKVMRERGMPRNDRRRFARKFLNPSGYLNAAALKELWGSGVDFKGFASQLHINDTLASEDFYLDYLTGRTPAKEFNRQILASIGDVPEFIEFFYDRSKQLDGFFASLRALGTEIEEISDRLRQEMKASAILLGRDAITGLVRHLVKENPLQNTRTKILQSIGQQEHEAIRRGGVNDDVWQSKVVESPVGSLPSLDTLLIAVLEHIRISVLPGSQRKLRISDAGDLMHLLYAPYVDAIRCDGYTAQVAKSVVTPVGTRVMSSFKEVLALVEAAA